MKVTYPKSYIVWDLETTGLEPTTEKILEIGALKVEQFKVVDSFNVLLNHDVQIPPDATAIHGITNKMIKDEGIDPAKGMIDFVKFLTNGAGQPMPNITHNGAVFDIHFLYRAFNTYVNTFSFSKIEEKMIDTAALYRAQFITESNRYWFEDMKTFQNRVLSIKSFGKYNLVSCCAELSVKLPEDSHRALVDCHMTHGVYKKLHDNFLCKK